jgi:amino acid adenylation domain-containing protein
MDGSQTRPVPGSAADADTSDRIALATDYRSSGSKIIRARQLEVRLDHATQSLLLSAAARLHTNLVDAALAAFAVLLHRLGNQADLTIGIVRGQPGSRSSGASQLTAAGSVQLSFDVDANFAGVLAQLRAAVRPQGDAAARESNVVFGETSNRDPEAALAASEEAPRELALLIEDLGTGLSLRLAYDARLFRPERMRALLDQFQLLLPRLLAEPERSLFDHSLVTAAARSLLPDPTRPIEAPAYPALGAAFAAWALRAPEQHAIRHAGRALSYGQLASQAEQIARIIRARVASGDVVAVTGPRSFALVSSLLGVFQSGAVLLTLDPTLPLDRRRVMLEQSGAKLILAADAAADCDALAAPERPLLRISEAGLASEHAAVSGSNSLPAIDPDQPAYVFFTSGSTGVPKAVLGRHKGLAHFLAWQREEFGILPNDRASQLTALSFDVVLRDMFLALTSGACLCLPECADVTDPARILGWLAQERVSVLHVVPSLARLWLSHVPEGLEFPQLRRVFFAGEPLTDVLVTRCREVFGSQVEIINLYGPTETTLAKCFHRIPESPDPGIQSIGKPMSHTQALILNPKRQLCGLAEVGEIAIRTPFRSLGYLNNPEASARAFAPNPFGSDPDDLIYLTGDSGRYRADGNVEILGRIDGQVKIRGVRIEPGEIEAALGHHPSVREVVVVARQDASDAKFLAAYVVPKTASLLSEPAASIAELRAFLRQRLPEVMIPSAFGLVAALPLNANGKVDKKALPVLERSAGIASSAAPESARERELAAIWREVLGLPEIGVHDSFYDLGGDSLTAVRVIIRMRVLGFEESVCRSILQGYTIAQVARAADGGPAATADQSLPLSPDARLRLSLNVVRGLLICLIIACHFTPGIARRSAFVAAYEKYLQPWYNWGTPGFAIAFGVTLGFIYYPQWIAHPERTRALLWRATSVVGAGAAMLALTVWAMSPFKPLLADESPFANVLSFYAMGLASAGLWFHVLGSSKAIRNALVFAVVCGFVHHGLRRFVGVIPARSPLLLLVGKWGYFNMWIGSLLGFAFGQRLKRYGIVPLRDSLLGALMIAAGLALSRLQDFESAFLIDQREIEAWKWLFYGGLSVWLMVALDRVIRVLPSAGRGRVALNVFGVFGQLTLPLFVLHYLVWGLGMACTAAGFPSVVRLSVEFGALIAIAYLMTRRVYRLYYGGEPAVQTQPVVEPNLAA